MLTAGAAYFAFAVLWLRAFRGQGIPSFDTYTYFYPNVHHALRSLRDGGGLLWNPYQDCGQPFFAISQTGLLYPVNYLFLLFDREIALIFAALINLVIGGIGMYRLCRTLRLATVPALCGAIAFQLGGTTAMLAAWSPIQISPFVWMPVAMWRVERLLRRPRLANGVWLGVVLTLQLLPGFPQITFFTYQLIALRTGWALITRRMQRPAAVIIALGLGCTLPMFLGAIHLIPSIAVARDSLRGLPLRIVELGFSNTWANLRLGLTTPGYHQYPGTVVTVSVVMLAAAAFSRRRADGLVLFHLGVAVLYLLLSLGDNGVLFPLYAKLPLGTLFRMPQRFLWVSGYAVAVLTAFGADALTRQAAGSSILGRSRALVLMVAAAAAFFAIVIVRPPTSSEWMVLAALVTTGTLLAWRGRTGMAAAAVLAILALNLAVTSRMVGLGLRSGPIYDRNADAFALLRERMTAQDRALLIGEHADLQLMPKSASLFRVPSIYDYEPQVSRIYGDYFTYLRIGRPMTSILDWYYPLAGVLPASFNQRLLNLTAARYVLIGRGAEKRTGHAPGWRAVEGNERWTLYENPDALERARFVPLIETAAPADVLPAIANGRRDARRVAILSDVPGSGFRGEDATNTGDAAFVVDEAERVVIDVNASAPGFLYLADQFASGWEATVNGAPTEILRANHAFRLVEVPSGQSRVEFRYRPKSVYMGAAVSGVTLLVLLAAPVLTRRRHGAGEISRDAAAQR